VDSVDCRLTVVAVVHDEIADFRSISKLSRLNSGPIRWLQYLIFANP
jgi:hypothetical protein